MQKLFNLNESKNKEKQQQQKMDEIIYIQTSIVKIQRKVYRQKEQRKQKIGKDYAQR